MSYFDIHINGDHDGYLHWSTSFNDDNQQSDADVAYINSVALELAKALKKLQALNPRKMSDTA